MLLGAALMGTALHAQELTRDETADLIARIRAARTDKPAITVQFRETRRLAALREPLTSEGQLWFQPPDRFRREVRSPEPSITVSDGQTLWVYYPQLREAERYALTTRSFLAKAMEAMTSGLDLTRLADNFTIEATRVERGWRLDLAPRTAPLRRLLNRLVLDVAPDLRIRRSEMTSRDGDITELEFYDEKHPILPPDFFDFTPPQGTRISTPMER